MCIQRGSKACFWLLLPLPWATCVLWCGAARPKSFKLLAAPTQKEQIFDVERRLRRMLIDTMSLLSHDGTTANLAGK